MAPFSVKCWLRGGAGSPPESGRGIRLQLFQPTGSINELTRREGRKWWNITLDKLHFSQQFSWLQFSRVQVYRYSIKLNVIAVGSHRYIIVSEMNSLMKWKWRHFPSTRRFLSREPQSKLLQSRNISGLCHSSSSSSNKRRFEFHSSLIHLIES